MKGKKIIPVLILLIIIVYLAIYIVKDIPNKKTESFNNTISNITNTNVTNNVVKNEWKDNNPITIGLYHSNSTTGKRELKTEYTANWTYHKDIISFNVFYTNEEELSNKKLVPLYEEYASKYDNIDDYRIGYIIEFNDTKVQILRPSDTDQIFNILEIYLYDAIAHKNDSWYSHTTDKEFNENTLLQGIKLTAGKNIDNITTNIKITAFTYDSDDFDENNNYKGISKYSLIVKKA